MLNRIFGLETEYGLLVHQDRPDHSPTWFAHKIRDHIFQTQRQGVLDLHHRGHDEPPGNGGFLMNAGRIYLDMGHLEYASPECQSLTDVVASDRAGDMILQRAVQDLGLADQVSLIRNNVDHETDATFGSHENYLVSRRFPFSRRGLAPLVTFLVTRQIFTGSGRVGAASPQDAWIQMDRLIVPRAAIGHGAPSTPLPFQISQRADHIVNDFFEWVQQNRAIVNTRDEPLADPNQYRRIHLLLGDSNMAEYATALKLGTTGLVLQLIEDGKAPAQLDLNEPVETLQEISQDQERQWIVRLESGKSISAIDLQEEFRAAACPLSRSRRRIRLGACPMGKGITGLARRLPSVGGASGLGLKALALGDISGSGTARLARSDAQEPGSRIPQSASRERTILRAAGGRPDAAIDDRQSRRSGHGASSTQYESLRPRRTRQTSADLRPTA
jgi:proteasome accessory factor A